MAESGSTRRVLLELSAVVLAMLGFVWEPWEWLDWPRAMVVVAKGLLGVLLGGALLLSSLRVRDDRRALGLAPSGPFAGLVSAVGFTALGAIALALAGFLAGTVHVDADRVGWAGRYVVGLIGQQLLLQCFVSNRVFELAPRFSAQRPLTFTVVVATSLFATLHLPNFYLVGLTGIAGAFWVWHFRRHANLWLVCASHLVLGVTAMLMLGKGPLLSLRVGYGAWKKMVGD